MNKINMGGIKISEKALMRKIIDEIPSKQFSKIIQKITKDLKKEKS